MEARDARRDDLLARRVDAQQRVAEDDARHSEHHADDGAAREPRLEYAAHALHVADAHVLARERDDGLIEGVHREVDELLYVLRRGVARHRDGAEGVYRRLDDDVRE